MARRLPPTMSQSTEAGDERETQPGGAPGIPEEVVETPPPVKVVARDPEEIAKLPPPKMYRVAMAKQVLYGGVPTVLRAGKTVSDATHDLHTLRAQGVILEEVPHGS